MNRFMKTKTPSTEAASITDSVTESTTQLSAPHSKANSWRGKLAAGILKRLLVASGDPPICVVLPDGQQISSATDRGSLVTIEIRDQRTIRALALDPLFQFGEAYADSRLEIYGDLAEFLTAVYGVMSTQKISSNWHSALSIFRRPCANSLKGSRQNIQHHYDIGNEFYKLWLDEQMVYTCAYFARKNFSLEQAQFAKADHVCRKLQLQPGMHVVEAGCGWGALALHMARNYGVRVTAVNVSNEQIDWAKHSAQQAGLQQQVQFVNDDWRNIKGKYDRFVSVGMLEHVGVKNYPQLGTKIQQSLRTDGIGLIHSIGQNRPRPFNSWIERRIFPGAYAATLKQMMDIFETEDFSVLDIENLRLHYAETLRRWLHRFEESADLVAQQFDERFVRMWRLYLAGSMAAFESGYLQLFQIVFAKGNFNNVPRTREHLYDSSFDPSRRAIQRPRTDGRVASANDWSHR